MKRTPNPANAPHYGLPPVVDDIYNFHVAVSESDFAKQHYMPFSGTAQNASMFGTLSKSGFGVAIPGTIIPVVSPHRSLQGDAPLELQPDYGRREAWKGTNYNGFPNRY